VISGGIIDGARFVTVHNILLMEQHHYVKMLDCVLIISNKELLSTACWTLGEHLCRLGREILYQFELCLSELWQHVFLWVNTGDLEEHAVFVFSYCDRVILVGSREGVQSAACHSEKVGPYAWLHDVTMQKTKNWTVIAMKTENLECNNLNMQNN
jgi:hypothetical protein